MANSHFYPPGKRLWFIPLLIKCLKTCSTPPCQWDFCVSPEHHRFSLPISKYFVFIDCHAILVHVFLPCWLTLLFLSVHMPRHRGLRPESCFALAFFSPKADVQCCITIARSFCHTFSLFLLFGKECALRGLFGLFLSSNHYFTSEYVMPSEPAPFEIMTSNLFTVRVYCQWDHLFRLSYLLPFYWYLFLAWQNSLGLDHLPE